MRSFIVATFLGLLALFSVSAMAGSSGPKEEAVSAFEVKSSASGRALPGCTKHSCQVRQGYDFNNDFYRSSPGSSSSTCCSVCSKERSCTGYTWGPDEDDVPTCFYYSVPVSQLKWKADSQYRSAYLKCTSSSSSSC